MVEGRDELNVNEKNAVLSCELLSIVTEGVLMMQIVIYCCNVCPKETV